MTSLGRRRDHATQLVNTVTDRADPLRVRDSPHASYRKIHGLVDVVLHRVRHRNLQGDHRTALEVFPTLRRDRLFQHRSRGTASPDARRLPPS